MGRALCDRMEGSRHPIHRNVVHTTVVDRFNAAGGSRQSNNRNLVDTTTVVGDVLPLTITLCDWIFLTNGDDDLAGLTMMKYYDENGDNLIHLNMQVKIIYVQGYDIEQRARYLLHQIDAGRRIWESIQATVRTEYPNLLFVCIDEQQNKNIQTEFTIQLPNNIITYTLVSSIVHTSGIHFEVLLEQKVAILAGKEEEMYLHYDDLKNDGKLFHTLLNINNRDTTKQMIPGMAIYCRNPPNIIRPGTST